MERSVYFWHYDGTHNKAEQLRVIGATVAWLKAGGDRGIAWIRDPAPEGFENEQWDDAYLSPLVNRGIDCRPWFYNWPVRADQLVVLTALAARWSDVIALNPETEWRVASPHSPYTSLAAGNRYAAEWVRQLRALIQASFGRVPLIGYSSCPTWRDFPYEGFDEACDFAMPQHYWPDELFPPTDGETGSEAGEEQVEAHLRRAGKAKPCVPILTACREYDDAGVVALAENALFDYPELAGFSAWEAGNAAFQADAMRRCYLLLREQLVTEEDVKVPARGTAVTYLTEDGQPVTVIAWDGYATRIGGTNFRDVGVTVYNDEEGKAYDRSLRANAMEPYSPPYPIPAGG